MPSDTILRQIVGVRGAGPYLGPNGSPLSAADYNTLNTYWDRYRGATSFIGATGPYAWMNTAENPVDQRAWNYLNANWGVIRGAKFFTDINWGDPRLVGLPDYYYEVYPQAMAAEPTPEVGAPAAASATPAPPASTPDFTSTYEPSGYSYGGGYSPSYSSSPLDMPADQKPQAQKAGLLSNLPSWVLPLVAVGLAMPIILGKTPGAGARQGPRRRRRR